MATNPSLRAVLFDLDGTLVETAPDLHGTLVEVMAGLGVTAPSLPALRTMIGDGARVLIRRALDAAGHPNDPELLDRLFHQFLAHYTAHPCRQSFAYEGVVPTLEALVERGLPLGVCTNKPYAPTIGLLKALDLSRFFGSVVGGDSLPIRKPDPEHALATLRPLAVAPEEAIFVGDSTNDVLTARAAGMKVIVVSFGYTNVPPRELGADLVIDHFGELVAAIDRLTA
ncbi:MAG TPA: phosphoglycolate phosphatase [Geminicoccus sp.]|uniref:phosphoglycolate phosphatase n=1 Tax=Geminicoccus sp. TaxID=2024832 RepID=UPI002E37EDE6|nr:phosphoglycolate phosphatase [Geminicoccus sp.]HEX2526417.1 phosphoglycolate phosphatase [Geminicoccus sp.]